MAQGDIQPPSETPKGGIFDEWKKASPKEKMFIVGGIAAVILIMLYLHGKQKATTINRGTATNVGGGTTPINTGVSGPPPTGTPLPPIKLKGQPIISKNPAPPPTKAPVSKQPTTVTKTAAGSKRTVPPTRVAAKPVPYQFTQQYRDAQQNIYNRNVKMYSTWESTQIHPINTPAPKSIRGPY